MKYLCICLIKFYRKCLSPLKRKPCCRFVPSCSAYAIEAFQKRGFFVGLIMSVWRILRCNPYCEGGYDPVPDKGLRYKGSRVIPTTDNCPGEGGGCCHHDSEKASQEADCGEEHSEVAAISNDRKDQNQ
ncbi:MAG: membrane protein insertion efficiency factor YidD [Clostridia bacterium]|nr:membrane protein insertion efficiency factor YidD [Clostridia bacterium]